MSVRSGSISGCLMPVTGSIVVNTHLFAEEHTKIGTLTIVQTCAWQQQIKWAKYNKGFVGPTYRIAWWNAWQRPRRYGQNAIRLLRKAFVLRWLWWWVGNKAPRPVGRSIWNWDRPHSQCSSDDTDCCLEKRPDVTGWNETKETDKMRKRNWLVDSILCLDYPVSNSHPRESCGILSSVFSPNWRLVGICVVDEPSSRIFLENVLRKPTSHLVATIYGWYFVTPDPAGTTV